LFSTACQKIKPARDGGTVKTDVKLGDGALATAGNRLVHYTAGCTKTAPNHHGKNSTARATATPFEFALGSGQV